MAQCALVALIDFMLLHLNAVEESVKDGKQGNPKKVTFEIFGIDLQETRREHARRVVDKIGERRLKSVSETNATASAVQTSSSGGALAAEIVIHFVLPDGGAADSCHAVIEVCPSASQTRN